MLQAGILPTLVSQKCVGLRLNALIWCCCGLDLADNVIGSVGTKLTSILKDLPDDKALVVNCAGIQTIDQQHGLASLRAYLSVQKATVLFLSDITSVLEDLKDALGPPQMEVSIPRRGVCVVYGKTVNKNRATALLMEASETEEAETRRIVEQTFEINERGEMRRLQSTPIPANGVFNARQLISDPRSFCLISVQMAERLERTIQRCKPSNPVVLAASLRGSPIAAAATFLCSPKIELEIVDHMGPKQALLEGYATGSPRTGLDYIYIGDFLIGGTEVKVAASYAFAHGCSLKEAIVVGSLLPPNEYKIGANVDSLVCLRNCNCKQIYKL